MQGLLTALDTAALAIENFLNTVGEFLFPIGIILFGVLIIERSDAADAIPIWLVPLIIKLADIIGDIIPPREWGPI